MAGKTKSKSKAAARVRRRCKPLRRRPLAPIELRDLEGSGDLPFVARQSTFINPTYSDRDPPLKDFEWSIGACEIADAALRRGYRLLVRCRPDFVAPATCQIVRQLRTPVRVVVEL